MQTKYTLAELGEALIEAHEAMKQGYLLNVGDLISVAEEIMHHCNYTFDSYRRLTPEDIRKLTKKYTNEAE